MNPTQVIEMNMGKRSPSPKIHLILEQAVSAYFESELELLESVKGSMNTSVLHLRDVAGVRFFPACPVMSGYPNKTLS
jgi:hypothetical protein